MKYMTLWRPSEEPVGAPSQEEMAAMGKLIEELTKEGLLVSTDGLQSSASGAIARQTKGKITITDGPFTETKELVAGYAIFNVKSRDQIIELAKRFLKVLGGDGVCEIRRMYEG